MIRLRALAGLTLCAAAFAIACSSRTAAADAEAATVSYTAGVRDAAGAYMGGTELRHLVAFEGRLYAGNGYWEDRPGIDGRAPGAQILALDGPAASWRVEHTFDERRYDGALRQLVIAALAPARFATDAGGRTLPQPVSMLLAGTWDLTGMSEVFTRDERGQWTASPLPAPRVAAGIQQVRAIAFHRDRATGIDRVFAGNDPYGIFAGSYDAAAPGRVRWEPAPELAIASISAPPAPGLGLVRVASLAECRGSLFAAIGQQVYRRIDGAPARWELLYTNPKPGYSETGLRGLTAIATPQGEALLAAVEGYAGRILRIDCGSGQAAEELDIQATLDRAWRTRVSYVIAAYNDMTPVPAAGGTAVLIGIEAFLPRGAPVPEGHALHDGLDGGGWYFLRHPDGRYDLRRIAAVHPVTRQPLVATRAIARSPFGDGQIYFAGFDANKRPAHDTGWILRAAEDAVLR